MQLIMTHVISILCGVLPWVIFGASAVETLSFLRDPAYDDILPDTTNVTPGTQSRSRAQCALFCCENVWCNSFFYNYVTSSCIRHRIPYVSTLPVNVTSVIGWRYYRMRTDSVCPGSANYIADRLTSTCFSFDQQLNHTWDDASAICSLTNETLLVLEPVEKAQFISDFLNYNSGLGIRDNIYIGATQESGQISAFHWIDGQPINLTATKSFWVPGKPKNSYANGVIVMRYSRNFQWSEAHDNIGRQFVVCERPFLK